MKFVIYIYIYRICIYNIYIYVNKYYHSKKSLGWIPIILSLYSKFSMRLFWSKYYNMAIWLISSELGANNLLTNTWISLASKVIRVSVKAIL